MIPRKMKNLMLITALPLASLFSDTCLTKENQASNKGIHPCINGHFSPYGDGSCQMRGCPSYKLLPP